MSKRKLPLEADLRWGPLEQALERHRRQRGPEPTQWDFNKALAAGALQALAQHADGHREVLPASAWEGDLCIDIQSRASDSTPSLELFSRKLGKRLLPSELSVFVWLPDYENIFSDPQGKSTPATQAQEVPRKRGRKASHPWTEIGVELVRRVGKNIKAAGNKSTNSWATELEQWCEDRYRKAPVSSELRAFIDDVLRTLRIERK